MDSANDFQKLHQSVPVTTQPTTEEQIRYFSKHASERNVFKWATTALQGTHGFLAFAAWTAIYTWMFQNVPSIIWFAPWLAGFSLFAMHTIFRATWETFWYDKLDDDPLTDSPIYVPVAIILLLLIAEVNGVQRFLTAQVKPPETKATDYIQSDFSTTVASIEQSYKNDQAAITATYKQKKAAATLPYDRQIKTARNRSAETTEERRQRSAAIAALERQRDAALAPVLAAEAAALEKSLDAYTSAKTMAGARRDKNIAAIDTHNTSENSRYTTQLGNVNKYAWIISVGLLAIIMMLSYRVVRINVKSGIIARRNYTVLDAHGNAFEVLWTALTDAFKRQWLRFSVGIHRSLSPKQAIQSFDGTVIARPGTYNTFPAPPSQQQPSEMEQLIADQEAQDKVLRKFYAYASKNPGWQPTEDLFNLELQKAKTMNGSYNSAPLGKPEAPAGPAAQPAGAAARQQPAPTPSYAEMLDYWRRMVLAQLAECDRLLQAGKSIDAIQDYIFTDQMSPVVKEGNRLRLVWGVKDADVVVRHLDRDHFVKLENLTEQALLCPIEPRNEPVIAAEDDELFKQKPNLFKQKIQAHRDDTGLVIGIKYQKENGTWTTYAYPAVRAQYQIYLQRAQKGEVTPAVSDGLEKWEYAMTLFPAGRSVVHADRAGRANVEVITHQEA